MDRPLPPQGPQQNTPPQPTTASSGPNTTAQTPQPPGQPISQPNNPRVIQDISTQTPPAPMQNTPPEHIMQTATKNDLKRSITGTIKGFLSFVSFIATVVIAALLINQFVFQSYYVDGTSMTPALQNDDRLIIEKVSKTLAGVQGKAYVPNRGDIIVLDSAVIEELGHNEQLIKRVIGLPGETVVVNEGVVTIKNQQQPQGFNADSQLGLIVEPTYTTARLQVTVPEGSVFVLGDNRAMNGSFDSRSFGPISLDKIEGRLSLRIFPFDRIQTY